MEIQHGHGLSPWHERKPPEDPKRERLLFAVRYQIVRDTEYLARDANAFEEDNVKRPQHNPRMITPPMNRPYSAEMRPDSTLAR